MRSTGAVGLAFLAGLGCGGEDPLPTPEPLPFEIRELRVPVDESGATADSVGLRYFYSNLTERPDPPVLVFQFGGPGSSAVEFLAFVTTYLPAWVAERFALVGLDEIGVGGSVAIRCPQLGATESASFQHPFLESTTDELVEVWDESTTACRNNYRYAPLLDTERHARDLERLRLALGADELNFLAFSYGTRVALTYAALHPERTGRLVLDSAVDPRARYLDQLHAQALAQASMLTRFLDWCEERGDCGFARQDFLDALTSLEAQPASSALRLMLIVGDLLFEPHWPRVAATLAAVLADLEGTLAGSNVRVVSPPAFIGTLCADTRPYDLADIEAEKSALIADLDTDLPPSFFADTFNGAYACLYWPTHESFIAWDEVLTDRGPDLEVLLVNSSGDPKSPVRFTLSLAEALPAAPRVRVEEVSHSLGLQGVNECVDTAIRDFLLDGTTDWTGVRDCPKSTLLNP